MLNNYCTCKQLDITTSLITNINYNRYRGLGICNPGMIVISHLNSSENAKTKHNIFEPSSNPKSNQIKTNDSKCSVLANRSKFSMSSLYNSEI